MNSTFNGWSNVDVLDLDATTNLILTGRTAKEALPDTWLYKNIGSRSDHLNILDFGCGMGRNTFGMGIHSPNWKVTGYDNVNMLNKTYEYCKVHYTEIPENVCFNSMWDTVKNERFDTIFCCLVLQHINEEVLQSYINDFKKMTSKLIVFGRRFNDDVKCRSTWTILEENGLIPNKFYANGNETPYVANGDPHEHNLSIYNI